MRDQQLDSWLSKRREADVLLMRGQGTDAGERAVARELADEGAGVSAADSGQIQLPKIPGLANRRRIWQICEERLGLDYRCWRDTGKWNDHTQEGRSGYGR